MAPVSPASVWDMHVNLVSLLCRPTNRRAQSTTQTSRRPRVRPPLANRFHQMITPPPHTQAPPQTLLHDQDDQVGHTHRRVWQRNAGFPVQICWTPKTEKTEVPFFIFIICFLLDELLRIFIRRSILALNLKHWKRMNKSTYCCFVYKNWRLFDELGENETLMMFPGC